MNEAITDLSGWIKEVSFFLFYYLASLSFKRNSVLIKKRFLKNNSKQAGYENKNQNGKHDFQNDSEFCERWSKRGSIEMFFLSRFYKHLK